MAFAVHPYTGVTISSVVVEVYSLNAPIYHYFTNREDLCAEVVWMVIADLLTRQAEALDAPPDGVPVRNRIRAATMVYLGHIATHPNAWAMPMRRSGGEPATVAELRARTRCDYVRHLQDLLVPSIQVCHGYAFWGYLGFIDAAALRWVGKGCPEKDRWILIDAALGALEGILGGQAA